MIHINVIKTTTKNVNITPVTFTGSLILTNILRNTGPNIFLEQFYER